MGNPVNGVSDHSEIVSVPSVSGSTLRPPFVDYDRPANTAVEPRVPQRAATTDNPHRSTIFVLSCRNNGSVLREF